MVRRIATWPKLLWVVASAVALLLAGGAGVQAGTSRPSPWLPSIRAETATIWAVGDGADAAGRGDWVAGMLEGQPMARFLYLGDVYESGTAEDFARNYEPIFGRFAAVTAPTFGNHEWFSRHDGYYPYWKGVRGTRPPDYYAFSIAGWQLLSLNSSAPHGVRSPQLTWLRRKIARRPGFGNCRLAFWHEPRYSASGHADSPAVEPFWAALQGKARLILNAHSHNYQRFNRRGSLVEVIAGTGGRRIYNERSSAGYPGLAVALFQYGAVRLQLDKGSANLAFVNWRGNVLDQKEIRCRRAAP